MNETPWRAPSAHFGSSARKALVERFGNARQFLFEPTDASEPPARQLAPAEPLRVRRDEIGSTATRMADREEMHLVVDEIVASVRASGAAICLYAAGGIPQLVHAASSSGARARDADAILHDRRVAAADDVRWVRMWDDAEPVDLIVLPIRVVADGDRLIVCLWFDALDDVARQAAEALHDPVRPLALAYFKSWLAMRAGARRLASLQAACDATDIGMIFVAASGMIACANDAASRLLDIGDGLRRHNTSIQAAEIADSVKLQVALNHVVAANAARGDRTAARSAPIVRLRRRAGAPLIAAIIPAEHPATAPGDIAAIIHIFDPELDTERLLAPLCRMYQLSPVEGRLACLLAAGQSLTKAAEALRIKEQTARSYLKNVFIKTDTNRQTELVHLMLTNTIRLDRSIIPEPF